MNANNYFKEGDRVRNIYTGIDGTVMGYKIYEDHSLIYVIRMDDNITAYCPPTVLVLLGE